MTDHHKFRYLLPPGNNFAFVAKFKIWIIISILLMSGAIASLFVNKAVRGEYMNWTIDFKGGTEIQFAFKDKTTGKYVKADAGKIRDALDKAGEYGFDVSEISWNDNGKTIDGMARNRPEQGSQRPAQGEAGGAAQKLSPDRHGGAP